MSERLIDDLFGEIGLLRRPIGEGAAEAVYRDLFEPKVAEHLGHSHVAERLFSRVGEDKTIVVGAQGPAASEDRNGLYRERHNMRLLHLHASSGDRPDTVLRSEEHTSELQSLMRISYAVFCLKKKN